ncbi:hypothetical protein GHK86_05705 [Acidimicrobiaceae bacterium USS-CC1]|uniref:Glycosyl hydrolase-like family 15 (GHL15) protein n=1 Tax=Acidiferrimicrobium australe TaxID=2664430 RepID=A0ABW9QQW6_9ACTN|nr:hypothetical protein [Acidiferrimicrobium australe]
MVTTHGGGALHRGAWLRYGGLPISDAEIEFAVEHYAVAVLQPWETAALERLKAARPDMTVLCYKCLSSSRSYEPGPIHTSGVSHVEAEESGEHWFAHRLDEVSRIEWATYPGHWQMAVWEEEYRQRWCDNVADELETTAWDGVMADNDVYDDYYGLRPPIEGQRSMADVRAALDRLVSEAGERLGAIGKLLVPNIAESRREPGRWARHSAYGGGFEEVWLAYGPDDYFDPETALAQTSEARGPGVAIMRVASDGTDGHPNFLYGLATLWIFGNRATSVLSATAHDGYNSTPFIPELDADLGQPAGDPSQRGNGWSRMFTGGWAGVNLNSGRRRKVTYSLPAGLVDVHGKPAPPRITLDPHRGAVFVRP